jgi:SEC-C motif-containing protein
MTTTLCHCGSKVPFADCCEPILNGEREALTAEVCMRARYSAFASGQIDYIKKTIDPDQRKEFDDKGIKDWSLNSQWHGLEIREVKKGLAEDTEGTVEFIASYRAKDVLRHHHEVASFKKIDGAWHFMNGEVQKQETVKRDAPKVGRNDPCTCGSGKKYKKCCGKV